VIETFAYRFLTSILRLALLVGIFAAGWLVYSQLPSHDTNKQKSSGGINLQIALQAGLKGTALDIPIELYPIDVVAARHEYFAERRAGKGYYDFLKERMNGRSPINARLDMQGQTNLTVAPGEWWIHAILPGDEDLEWRLHVNVAGQKQTVELTPDNAYTRTKSF
jgi:hypothetical protein